MIDPSQARDWLSARAWLAMIACDVAIGIGVLVDKVVKHYPTYEYAQLLATYRFGIIRRALVGQIWALVHEQVAAGDVYLLGAAVILVTIVMFLFVFGSIFRFSADSMPLLALTFGSPFWFKNFVYTIGYFDILGCLSALIVLALPLNAFYMLAAAGLCIFLLFVHHIHFLLYVPAIGLIALLRHRAAEKCNRAFVAQAAIVALATCAAFVFLTFFVRPPVSPEIFLQSLRDRAADPVDPDVLRLWYSTIAEEIERARFVMAGNLMRVPIYAVLILLHGPLIGYFCRLLRALANRADRLFVVAGLAVITAGYIAICVVVFDYSRWVSNWAVCMMLVMFAVRLLPSRAAEATIALTPRNATLAWIVTLIPRVGITRPF